MARLVANGYSSGFLFPSHIRVSWNGKPPTIITNHLLIYNIRVIDHATHIDKCNSCIMFSSQNLHQESRKVEWTEEFDELRNPSGTKRTEEILEVIQFIGINKTKNNCFLGRWTVSTRVFQFLADFVHRFFGRTKKAFKEDHHALDKGCACSSLHIWAVLQKPCDIPLYWVVRFKMDPQNDLLTIPHIYNWRNLPQPST